MHFPRLSIGKVLTFAVMFLVVAFALRFLPEQYKQYFRV